MNEKVFHSNIGVYSKNYCTMALLNAKLPFKGCSTKKKKKKKISKSKKKKNGSKKQKKIMVDDFLQETPIGTFLRGEGSKIVTAF